MLRCAETWQVPQPWAPWPESWLQCPVFGEPPVGRAGSGFILRLSDPFSSGRHFPGGVSRSREALENESAAFLESQTVWVRVWGNSQRV